MEPKWKTFLNWAAVGTFFSLPILVMTIQLLSLRYPNLFTETFPQQEFAFLKEYERMLGALVLGLSGFKSWEIIKKNGHNGHDNHNKHNAGHKPINGGS